MIDAKHKRPIQLIAITAVAVGLKYYFSAASANALLWILTPTAFAVEFVTGTGFSFESYAGYINEDKTFLIAASCSGLNFLVMAFLTVSLGFMVRTKDLPWKYIPISMAIAYLSTIAANTVRIATALRLQEVPAETGLFSDKQIHRIEGILVYFGFLLLLFYVPRILLRQADLGTAKKNHPHLYFLVPLCLYYFVTLAVPFANGAYNQGAVFWEHVAFVVVTPLILLAPIGIVRLVRSLARKGI